MLDMPKNDDAKRGRMIDLIDAISVQGQALELLHTAMDKHRDVDADTWASVSLMTAVESLEESIGWTLTRINAEMWERSLAEIADANDALQGGGPGVALSDGA